MNGVISLETIRLLYTALREIEAGEKLLADMEAEYRHGDDKYAPRLEDAFGRRRHLQLGIPSGENAHRMLDVSPVLAESCIRAHIANKRKEFQDANERARIELNTATEESKP
jgi:hypothetical protein